MTVSAGGEVQAVVPAAAAASTSGAETTLPAPLAGNIVKIMVSEGQTVNAGDVVMIMEAMKMETEVRANDAGVVASIPVKEGDAVQVGDTLLSLS